MVKLIMRENILETTEKNELKQTEDIAAKAITGSGPKDKIDRPFSNSPEDHPVNGNYAPDDEDDEDKVEEDLILGDEDELVGNEEEFEVELDEDINAEDIDEDDLVLDTDDIDDDEDDDL